MQPTQVGRASVIDPPPDHAKYEPETFTPRSGRHERASSSMHALTSLSLSDMLGFKLEVPARAKGTDRPIYLDLQVSTALQTQVDLRLSCVR